MAYPPLNTAIQTTIACGDFFFVFFSAGAAPGIEIDENRENKGKTGRGRIFFKTNNKAKYVVFSGGERGGGKG
jgi:hypothetical protein